MEVELRIFHRDPTVSSNDTLVTVAGTHRVAGRERGREREKMRDI